jgi:hypothetical protein
VGRVSAEQNQARLDAERASRPDWASVSVYLDNADKLVAELEQHAFTVIERENGYDVKADGHGRAVYWLDGVGKFRHGWVETPGGRDDFDDWDAFLRMLTSEASA